MRQVAKYYALGTRTAREVPPVPPTEGQVWYIPANGHVAVYRDGAWVAVTPDTDNVAVILGNGELVLDTASVTGA